MRFDYVIIGAGSAGCVAADRLSQGGARVLALEAGGGDGHPYIAVPAAAMIMLRRGMYQWKYATSPDAGLGGRSVAWPRGKVLGGSSSINGMNFVRGNPADFDRWAQMGCRGWSYDEVLPYFRDIERYAGGGDAQFRGRDGPLAVEDYRTVLDATHRFVEASQQAGHPFTPDINGQTQEGVGYSQMSRSGRFRSSTSRAFLARARRRPTVQVQTGALASRLLFDGPRCVGVAYQRNGTLHEAHAAREVIVSAGSIASPQLLQISGVGPAGLLREIGAPQVLDLPGVGENLSDHLACFVVCRTRGLQTINMSQEGLPLVWDMIRWAVAGRGSLTFGGTSTSVFCRSRPGLDSPDLQLLFMPGSFDRGRFAMLEREPGISIGVCPVRPQSRGFVRARSTDPAEPPQLQANYLQSADDLRVMIAGLRIVRDILSQPAIAGHIVSELFPGPDATSDEALADYVRKAAGTAHHQVGTCSMGDGPTAVVDCRLRVRGLSGLRVVDASVMPTLTTGNTNAPSIMIGAKGAAMILEDHARPSPEEGEVRSR